MNGATELRLGDWIKQPLADLSPEILPFWEGLTKGEFRLCRCKRCAQHYFPFTVCNRHDDIPDFSEMEWAPVSGTGKVFAVALVRVVGNSAYAADVPYALAMIELDEGPLFGARVVGCPPESVKIGMPVKLHLQAVPETGQPLPFFTPS